MSAIADAIDTLNGLDTWMQWGFGLISTLITLAIVRYLMRKVVLDFVKATSFGWDDELYRPVTSRMYGFILLGGTQLTMNWVLGKEDDLNTSLEPIFQALYILFASSLLSVALKVMIPVIIDKFSNPGTVTVSGSNSLVVFLLRAAVWFLSLIHISEPTRPY